MTDETPSFNLKITLGFAWAALGVVFSCVCITAYAGYWFASTVTGPIAASTDRINAFVSIVELKIAQMQKTIGDYHEEAVSDRRVSRAENEALYRYIYSQGRNGKNDRNHVPDSGGQ